ncbi:MAG TPA: phosphatase PAP2 family protein [Actinomycetota bacterium]|nr:phosphatase PAP2 family protein [Actinomycetota bacterium]
MPIARWKYRSLPDRVVSPDTELVIEGFERSANWFAVAAFTRAQNRAVRIAHHLHAPGQILRAVRLGVPTILLIRDPEDAVVSQMIRSGGVRPRQALANWIRYHELVAPAVDSVVVADFDRVRSNFGGVIDEVNAKFGTDFELFEATSAAVQECFRWIEQVNRERYGQVVEAAVARPSESRARMKPAVRERVRAPELAPLRERARSLYEGLARGRAEPGKAAATPTGPTGLAWLRRRLEPGSPVGLPLSAAIALAGLFTGALGYVAQGIADREPILGLDVAIARAVALHRDMLLTGVMRVASWLGALPLVLLLGLTLSAFSLLRRRDWRAAIRAIGGITLSSVISDPMESWIWRAYPHSSLSLVHASGNAFPDERIAQCVAVYGALALTASRQRSGDRQAIALGTLSVGLVLLFGASQVYLDAQWFSDVAAGLAIGGIVLCVLVAITSVIGTAVGRSRPPSPRRIRAP